MISIYETGGRMNKLVNKKNRYLIIARVGDASLHKKWIEPYEYKNFDLFIDYYGDIYNRYQSDCSYYEQNKGLKWPKLHSLIEKNKDIIFQYDAVWFPDDDINTDARSINNMFELFTKYKLKLAQPALTKDSYFTHGITIENFDFVLRYTDFVEVMAPIFSRESLNELWETFNKSKSGWGLDNIWPKKLNASNEEIAILDSTPVKHTRPVGGGDLYKKLEISPHLEVSNLLKEFQVLLKKFRVLGGILKPEQITICENEQTNLGIHILRGAPNELISVSKFANEYLYPNITRLLKGVKESEEEMLKVFNFIESKQIYKLIDYDDNLITNSIEKYSKNLIGDLIFITNEFIERRFIERAAIYLNNAVILNDGNPDNVYNIAKDMLRLGQTTFALNLLNSIENKDTKIKELIHLINKVG